ncbi:MAG TPA: FAD-dependent oxidoreductase [Candidatus Dormibacteraeota bacterium]
MAEAAYQCDVLVIGSGAAGLSAAVTAGKEGLKTLVVEKDSHFGGTTATSGGVSWIAESPHAKRQGLTDTIEDARTYIAACIEKYGRRFDADRIDAYLANGPRMVEFMEENTRLRWAGVAYFPDYHPELPGHSDKARALNPAEYDAQKLPRELRKNLKWPWTKITFMGLQVSAASREQHHFYNASRSPASAAYVMWLLAKQARDLLFYGRSKRLVNGNAVVAMLAHSCHDFDVPIWISSPAVELIKENGRVRGAYVEREGQRVRVDAAKGVVLASGGFSWDQKRRKPIYPHEAAGAHHFPFGTSQDTGDGARIAERVGAHFSAEVTNAAAWAPATPVPQRGGRMLNLPHQRTYAKPGMIAVTRKGVRFTNDAIDYHDMVQEMIRACAGEKDVEAFVIGDHQAVRKYGFGIVVKPYPFPIGPHIKAGYLFRANTIAELADRAGIDRDSLVATVDRFNHAAAEGKDPEFHRGETEYDRLQGDPAVKPNPCLAPIVRAPFYALKMVAGDSGSFAGLRTDQFARVLDGQGTPIEGLYAAGNDMESIFSGDYPGGGVTIGPAMVFGYIAALHMAGKPVAAGPETSTAVGGR